jgi:hypothetical protein
LQETAAATHKARPASRSPGRGIPPPPPDPRSAADARAVARRAEQNIGVEAGFVDPAKDNRVD